MGVDLDCTFAGFDMDYTVVLVTADEKDDLVMSNSTVGMDRGELLELGNCFDFEKVKFVGKIGSRVVDFAEVALMGLKLFLLVLASIFQYYFDFEFEEKMEEVVLLEAEILV